MFKCDKCKRTTKAREPMKKVVLQKRDKVYLGGSQGWEIVVEGKFCTSCAAGE